MSLGLILSPFMSSSAVFLHQPLEAPASIPLAQPSAQKENLSFLGQMSPGAVSLDKLVSLTQGPRLGDTGPLLVGSGSLTCSWNLEVPSTQTSGRKSGPCYQKTLHSQPHRWPLVSKVADPLHSQSHFALSNHSVAVETLLEQRI